MAKVRLSTVRNAVIDYFSGDMSRYIDTSTLRDYDDGDDGEFIVTIKTFDTVSGYEKLGSGRYADVYAIDDKRAMKIVKAKDSGYARFVKLCRNNRHNPHLPKIHYSGIWGDKQIYIMERLATDPVNELAGCTTRFGGAVSMNEAFREAIRNGLNNPFFSYATPEIAEVARLLKGMTNDLHSGNLMFRGDTPVITDPTTHYDS